MRLCVTFCMLWLAGVTLGEAEEYKVVCYFASWATHRSGDGKFSVTDIDPTLCSHVIYPFVGITEYGGVEILDAENDLAVNRGYGGFQKFVALREFSPETKFMASIGGWSQGSERYSKVVANSSLRYNFVESIVNFTIEYGFDGFDFDWEYPAQRNGSAADVENFVLLLQELRPIFDENRLLMSAAVPAAQGSASTSYNIPAISKYLDFIDLMAYEYHGAWDGALGENAPLYPATRETTAIELTLNIDASVRYWLDQGAPAEKLVLGMAFYGKTFTLKNPSSNVPGSLSAGPGNAGKYTGEAGVLAYYEICEHIVNDGWTSAWDEEQRVPYAYKDDQWVSYDNVRSIKEKTDFIKKWGLGGAMVWSIDQDDFRGRCGEPMPLLNTIVDELGRNAEDVCD